MEEVLEQVPEIVMMEAPRRRDYHANRRYSRLSHFRRCLHSRVGYLQVFPDVLLTLYRGLV